MMKKLTQSVFNRIISTLVFLTVVFSGSVSAQGWGIYDGSVLPNATVPVFSESSGVYYATENLIVDDVDTPGNKYLWMEVNGNPQTQFLWRMNFATQGIAVTNLTVVMRVKGHVGRDMAVDLDMHYSDLRSRITIHTATKLLRIRNGSGTNVTLGAEFDPTAWNTYRFTMTATETNLYINESTTPSLTFAPAVSASGNRHFRIGDGDGTLSFGADIDWVLWDVTGAYAPGEGTPIPTPVVTPSWDANLDELKADDVLISGFSPATLSYQLVLPVGTTEIPVISALQSDENATVEITQAAAIPGTATVKVTAENGITIKTYSVLIRHASTIATLQNILVNNVSIAGFSSNTFAYTVNLPLETTTEIPVVSALTTDANAEKAITQATAVDGEATIVVTAEDGATELTYTVDFVLVSVDATLKDLLVDGVTISGFDPEVIEYSLVFAEGTTEIPVVTAFSNSDNAEVDITQATAIPGTATVVVTAQDGVTKITYTINLLVGSSDATLSDLLVDGTTIEGFDPEVTDYYIVLPISVTDVPVVTATATDENATVDITPATEIPGITTILVTAEDNFTELTYKVHFRYGSSDATLSDLLINGTSIVGFDPEVISYEITMPKGSVIVPSISAVTNNENAVVAITPAEQIPGSTVVLVTSEDNEVTKSYTINFNLGAYNWRYYDGNLLPDLQIPKFASSNVGGAGGTNVIIPDPENETNGFLQIITAANGDNYMWSTPLQTSTPAVTLVMKVKAANDVARRVLELDVHHNAIRERLYINREENKVRLHEGIGSTEIAVPEGTNVNNWNIYRLTKEGSVTKLYINENPIPIAVGNSATATTSQYFRFGDGNGSHNMAGLLDWIVWDETGAYAPGEGLFIPAKVVTPSWDASLADLLVDDVEVEGFDPEVLDYNYLFDVAPTVMPVVSATPNFEGATLEITQIDVFPGTALVEVTAENGFTVSTYSVVFRTPSNVATLSDLLVNGVTVEDFAADVLEYNVVLPAGTSVIPTVTAIATDANAEVDITQASALPGLALVSVTAEDGTNLEYKINFTVATSTGITEKTVIKLFPNPATTSITVEWSDATMGADLKIFCTSGRVVLQKRIESNSDVIDISNLSSGIYIVQLVGNNLQVRSRFIKQ
jgi:hypothetical protein